MYLMYLSICLSVYLSICLSVYLSIYLSICPSVCLSTYLCLAAFPPSLVDISPIWPSSVQLISKYLCVSR